jgi:adenine-specific DNA-methyltransferase
LRLANSQWFGAGSIRLIYAKDDHGVEAVLVNDIFRKDAFRFLAALDDCSVDLVISSPPYFMGKEYDTSSSVADFIAAHERLLGQLVRILKRGGSICWQIGHHVSDNVEIPLDALVYSVFSKSELLKLRNRIVWTFGHGEHCRRRFSGRHETVLWFTKGDDYHFDLDAVRVPQKYPGKRYYKGPKYGKPSGNPLGKNPGDVWEIPHVKAAHVEKTEHPCQFPVALAQRLVRALCPTDGVVVDPYLGSGSTAVAAVLEGRHFTGSDIKAKYIKIARARVQSLMAGTLKIRPIDSPILIPPATQSVAKTPIEWLQRSKHA